MNLALRVDPADAAPIWRQIEQGMQRLVADSKPEIVYHLATHGAYPFQTNADGIIQTNILGTWNLLKALARTDYEVFVNTGSSSEYGFKEYAMRETDLLEPNSYYSVAKCAQSSAPGGGIGSQLSSSSTPKNNVPSEPAMSRQRLNGLSEPGSNTAQSINWSSA